MSLMCSMKGCKQKVGMCGHEKKMMAGLLVLLVVGYVAGKAFGLFSY